MSFWPSGFDPRAEILGALVLVDIDAPSGLARFMLGQDGVFTDRSGNKWWGSQLIGADAIEWGRDAEAAQATLTLTYYQDPQADSLIEQLRDSGDEAIKGSRVRFFIQPLTDMAQLYAPLFDPVLVSTKTASSLGFSAEGDVVRRLTLTMEGPFAGRRSKRGLYYTVNDHEALIGEANPSLTYMPNDTRQREQLFG